eukprot:scaffold624_cov402-Prasinococcus_capsulatus_cf.AAC.62
MGALERTQYTVEVGCRWMVYCLSRVLCSEDTLYGNSGRDTLFGGIGQDFLVGGKQADVLRGGPGLDVLKGGPGADKLFGCDGDTAIELESSIDEGMCDFDCDDNGVDSPRHVTFNQPHIHHQSPCLGAATLAPLPGSIHEGRLVHCRAISPPHRSSHYRTLQSTQPPATKPSRHWVMGPPQGEEKAASLV